jgi:hypothetical protein
LVPNEVAHSPREPNNAAALRIMLARLLAELAGWSSGA